MKPAEAFFLAIDRAWQREGDANVRLRVLGASALLLRVERDMYCVDATEIELPGWIG